MGTEEITVIEPATVKTAWNKISIFQPLSWTPYFYYAYRGEYDAVVAMYPRPGIGST